MNRKLHEKGDYNKEKGDPDPHSCQLKKHVGFKLWCTIWVIRTSSEYLSKFLFTNVCSVHSTWGEKPTTWDSIVG